MGNHFRSSNSDTSSHVGLHQFPPSAFDSLHLRNHHQLNVTIISILYTTNFHRFTFRELLHHGSTTNKSTVRIPVWNKRLSITSMTSHLHIQATGSTYQPQSLDTVSSLPCTTIDELAFTFLCLWIFSSFPLKALSPFSLFPFTMSSTHTRAHPCQYTNTTPRSICKFVTVYMTRTQRHMLTSINVHINLYSVVSPFNIWHLQV